MPDQSTPEIDRLNEIAHRPDKRSVTQWTPLVALPDAIQAVRDTELRVTAAWQDYGTSLTIDSIARHARREAFREAEAWIRDRGSWRTRDLADEFRFRFLSPDNPEGNA